MSSRSEKAEGISFFATGLTGLSVQLDPRNPDVAKKMLDYSPVITHPYNPNMLFDVLLETFGLENDEALGSVLHIGAPLIRRIRCGQAPVEPLLLLRMNELSGISVRELRRLMGDRRADWRLSQARTDVMTEEARDMPPRRKTPDAGDAGLPSTVQWT
jgi:hypothetical protein